MVGQAHPAQGSEHQDSNFGLLCSDTVHREDLIVSSLTPETICQLPDAPAPKQIHLGLTCSAGHAWQAPGAGLLGHGSAYWAMAPESGSHGKTGLLGCSPLPS